MMTDQEKIDQPSDCSLPIMYQIEAPNEEVMRQSSPNISHYPEVHNKMLSEYNPLLGRFEMFPVN